MGKRLANRIEALYAAPRGRWLLSALMAALCVVLTYAFFDVTFLNNDDTNIMYALAGYRTGAPYPTHRFINVLLGLFISGLYTALPAVPWWAAYQLGMLLLSLTVIGACVLKTAHHSGVSPWPALVLAVILYLGAFVYAVAWMTFTLTAGMLGTAAVALLLSLDESDAARTKRLGVSGAILLLLLCFFTRNSSGYSMLCFIGAAALYRLVSARKGARRRVIAVSAVGAALVMLAVFVNGLGVSYYNPSRYGAFEAARGHFIDYPHAAYADDPAFFDEMGWDETIYDLADNLCYIDPAVDAETMERAAGYRLDADKGVTQRLSDTLAYGIDFFRGSGATEYMLVLVVLMWLVAPICYSTNRRGRLALFIACATAAGAFLICFYLCYKGRFPVRTFMLVAIPTTVVEALLSLKLYGLNERRFLKLSVWRTLFTQKSYRQRKAFYAVAAVLSLLAVCWSLTKTQIALFSYDKSQRVAESAAVEEYVMAHPDNVYITDVTSVENLAAFTTYPDAKPTNLIDWGGTSMPSGWKTAQIAINGFTALSADMFARDNVYFITERDGDKLRLLNAYLEKHAGARGYVQTDEIAGAIVVYRFGFVPGGEARP